MKHKLLISIIILSLCAFSTSSEASALQITYVPFHFFVEEPTTITHPDMLFHIANNENEPMLYNITFSTPEDLEISAKFQWDTIIINANSKTTNRYSLIINNTFSIPKVKVEINVHQLPLNSSSGSTVTASATIVNYITFYSEESGAILDLQIVDQADRPREAYIDIQYRPDTESSWTPLKTINASHFYGAVPLGFFQVQAIDTESSVAGSTTFEVTENTQQKLEMILVGFTNPVVRIIGEQNKDGSIKLIEAIGFNASINNFIGTLYNVEIYAILYLDGEEYLHTNKEYRQEFATTSGYKIELWFPQVNFKSGSYSVIAFIDASGINIVDKFIYLPAYIKQTSGAIELTMQDVIISVLLIVVVYQVIKSRKIQDEKEP